MSVVDRLPRLSAAFRRVEPYLPERARLRMVGVGVSGFVSGGAEAVVLVLVAVGADALVQGEDRAEVLGRSVAIGALMLVAAGLLVLKAAAVLVNARLSSSLGGDVLTTVRTRLADSYLASSFARRSGRHRGDLQVMITSHAEAVAEFTVTLAWTITILLNLVTFAGAAVVVSPLAAIGIVVLGALLLAALRPLTRSMRGATRDYLGGLRALGADATELEGASRDLETFGVRREATVRLAGGARDSSRAFGRSRALQMMTPPLYQSMALMLIVAVLGLLSLRDGSGGLAGFAAVVLLLLRSLSAGQQLVTASQRLGERGTYVDQVTEELAADDRSRPRFGDRVVERIGGVELDGVSFRYPGGEGCDAPVALQDVRATIAAEESVGVIGPSGAGKSTLIQVLLRLQVPTAGSVRLGGVDIAEIDPGCWADLVAYVPQEPVVIRASVADNIRFFRSLPDERIREAARRAHLDEVLDALPDGPDTVIEPGGSGLSGGQRQRVAIARALAGHPRLLVLDEPTSALDPVSEVAIQDTLRELHGTTTVVVVAHRLSTLSSCDRLLVLAGGRVEAFDTPDRLRDVSAYYLSARDDGGADR
jgi:ABC-type multidrug transport system fused ATPase/permease subunit